MLTDYGKNNFYMKSHLTLKYVNFKPEGLKLIPLINEKGNCAFIIVIMINTTIRTISSFFLQ